MDVKALAKSKRAHSNHHSKKHQPHQASKVPSVASDSKKPTGKQAKGKPPQADVDKPLLSNWERYSENEDSVFEESQTSSSQQTEFVVPRSKGADYAHLISEAKDQARSNYYSDATPLSDDVINDFTQGFGPMLLASKGQSILSWVTDDDFEFEGKTGTNLETPFLSLNLNALADQLAKAKLSERCFLDADRFPLELLDNAVQERDEDKRDQPETCISVESSEGELKPVKEDNFEIRSVSPKPVSELASDSTAKSPPIFQATSAEAELDMLLSSFGETKIIESTGASSMDILSTSDFPGKTVNNRTDLMIAGNLNDGDDIDKLLEETSNPTNIDSRQISNEAISSSTLNPGSKSKLLDDFDSWLDTI